MRLQLGIYTLLLTVVAAILPGCGKSPGQASSLARTQTTPDGPPHKDTIARVYWMGKTQLGVEATAYYPMRLWLSPESRKIENIALQKLAFLPLQCIDGDPQLAASFASLMVPLLHDTLQCESFLEVRKPVNQGDEAVLAVQLPEASARGWATNLVVAGSLLRIPVNRMAADYDEWELPTRKGLVRFARMKFGDWTLIGWTMAPKNGLLAELAARIRSQGGPFVPADGKTWLQADLDLSRIPAITNLANPARLPRLSASVTGDGANAIAQGTLDFPSALQFEIQPWSLPQELIQQPLAAFTAIRGFTRPGLVSLGLAKDFPLDPFPNQAFFWSKEGSSETYMALPSLDPVRQINAVTGWLTQNGNPWLSSNATGEFQASSTQVGAVWSALPNIQPFLEPIAIGQNQWMLAGIMPKEELKPGAPPAQLPLHVLSESNLICFDWEATAPRIESGVFVSQVLRVIFKRSQLPLESVTWLRDLAPRLAVCRTVVRQTGPSRLTFERKATVGLSAMELQLFADWLASPHFPRGLHTTLTPAVPAGPGPQ